MINTLRMVSFQALLAGALAAQPSLAGQFDGPSGTDKEDRTGVLLKQLEELTKSVNDLVKELKNLPANLSETNRNLRTAVAQEEIERLKQQVGQLQKDLGDLRTRTPPQASSSLYPPPGTATGRLRLINSYSVPVSIIVNDLSYQLAPGAERPIELRPGPFTFEVLAVGYGSIKPRVTRTLAANETYTIQVEPQR